MFLTLPCLHNYEYIKKNISCKKILYIRLANENYSFQKAIIFLVQQKKFPSQRIFFSLKNTINFLESWSRFGVLFPACRNQSTEERHTLRV